VWKKIDASKIKGTIVYGDKRVPKTRWWLLPLLFLFIWKKRVVLSVAPVDVPRGFRLGYKPEVGPSRLSERLITAKRFQVRVGRENCTFFALSPEGHEVPLRLAGETDRSDPWLKKLPLY
jgi:hypothetical protein